MSSSIAYRLQMQQRIDALIQSLDPLQGEPDLEATVSCPKCHSTHVIQRTVRTRLGLDEPETPAFECEVCMHAWRAH